MALLNDPKFMVYMNGFHPEQLCLGHLVLGNHYNDPVELISRRCPASLLNTSETEQWAYVSDWHGRCVANKSGKLGFGLETMELLRLSVRTDWKGAKVLEAGSGRKIVLKDSKTFLREKVLCSPETRATLKSWLSTVRTNNMFHQFSGRRAKIWMLTGLYELSYVRSGTINEKHPSLGVEVSSTVMEAAAGVPVGPSIDIGRDSVTYSVGVVERPMVYAARYQLLKAEYFREACGDGQLTIQLHPDDIYSRGYVMGDNDADSNDASEATCAVLEIAEEAPDVGAEEEMDSKYWKEFDSVERKFKRRDGRGR